MDQREVKQKIRKLKKLELKFRYGYSFEYIEKNGSSDSLDSLPLVWKEFFNLSPSGTDKVRYSLSILERMDKEQLKQVIDEFWFHLYFRMYQERGLRMEVLEPGLLDYLRLPYDADQAMVRKRFRELCRQLHPDEGGDQEKFIELMDMMERYEMK